MCNEQPEHGPALAHIALAVALACSERLQLGVVWHQGKSHNPHTEGLAGTALHPWAASCCCSCWTRGKNCWNPTFFQAFLLLQYDCKKHPRSRIWSFIPFLSRKASKTAVHPLFFASLNPDTFHWNVVPYTLESLLLYLIMAPSPSFLCQKSWPSPKAEPSKKKHNPVFEQLLRFPHESFLFLYDLMPPLQLNTPDDRDRPCNLPRRQDSCYSYPAQDPHGDFNFSNADGLQNPSISYLLMLLKISKTEKSVEQKWTE